jgi:branched-subunit amino acid aminotransferase/4-amino-4-deoxychorismate lyase
MENILSAYRDRLTLLDSSTNIFAKGIAFIEGEYHPIHEARIPILDQGFLRSDLTYDVPAVWDGRYFRLDDHLDRLEASCAKLRFRPTMDRQEMRDRLVEMVSLSGIRDAYVEIIVTRGLDFVRYYETAVNHVYLMVMPYVWGLREELQLTGGSAIVARTVRRTPPGAMDPTVKNLQWGDFCRGIFECVDRGSIFPLLTDGDGGMTEGAGYNVFLLADGKLRTPSRGVLEGVTRRTVLEIAGRLGLAVEVDYVPVDDFYAADEIFLSTTAGGIMPIVELDGKAVGSGSVGAVTTAIRDAYWQLHYDPAYSFAVDYPT